MIAKSELVYEHTLLVLNAVESSVQFFLFWAPSFQNVSVSQNNLKHHYLIFSLAVLAFKSRLLCGIAWIHYYF